MVGGPFVHVVYAYPSDGADRSAQLAPQIADDVAQIEAWWATQDPTRVPRFDVIPFSCGLQPDVTVVRLPQAGSQLATLAGRHDGIASGLVVAGLGTSFGKYIVYYDGPAEPSTIDVCGESDGQAQGGPSFPIVYTTSCSGVPSAPVAAHELLHALGALPLGAPHSCSADDRGHPCDSEQDLLFPFASGAPLAQLLLDVGHDDYYGHPGAWFDLQDSAWLKHVGDQAALTVAVQGGGKVVSLQPGPDCVATCSAEWDRGTNVMLEAIPSTGKRLLRWTGACRGAADCSLTLDAPASVTALFGPARFRLSLTVGGKGTVRSTPRGLVCRVRCAASFTSFRAVRLSAIPAKGWRFARWTGACAGKRLTCSVPMTRAASARAVFARRR